MPGVVHRTRPVDFDYVEGEWFASGVDADGRAYTTQVHVRRPRDAGRFSGTVIVEPLHFSSIAPIFMYCSPYAMRSGHGWAVVASQKTALDQHVKGSDPARYDALHIETAPSARPVSSSPPSMSADALAAYWRALARYNEASSAILAQVGAALRESETFADCAVEHVLLAGHSQTGFVTTNYIREAHESQRLARGRPVFDGYFPTGYPAAPFGSRDVPLVQVLSDGDISHPEHSFSGEYGRRQYRRDDSDAPNDRYRLYELAGVPHMGTRYPPFNDVGLWASMENHGSYGDGARMSTLPHNELFSMALDHLVHWVADGVTPPHAERLVTRSDGWLASDEHGNTLGGVRCVQLDVPRARYLSNAPQADGSPGTGTVGTEVLFDAPLLRKLYGTHDEYAARFRERLDGLVGARWMLVDDVEEMQAEADRAGWQWDDA
ncbi:MAG: hypothetical protein JOZ99_11445 [Actinobacteria bacterium]|nr:hypothetical protein [Actinomycetota bacterium]